MSSSLTGLQKAAALLTALGEQTSALVVKHLSEEEVEKVSQAIAQMQPLRTDEAESVIHEFNDLLLAQQKILKGGLDYTRSMLSTAFGEEAARRVLDRVQTGVARESSSLDTLQQADPKRLAELIQNEHPQTIALILSRLHSGPAVTLLSSLPAVVRADVAMRMAMLDQINPEILAKISGVVENKLQAFGELAIGSYGGARAVAEIFNRLDRTLSGEILTAIQKADGTLHDSIKHLMFVFEDLLALDVSALKEIVGKVDRKVLTIALKGVSEPLKTKLLSVMSQRSAEILREDMDVLGPVKIRDVQAAQGQMISVVREMEQNGTLSTQENEYV